MSQRPRGGKLRRRFTATTFATTLIVASAVAVPTASAVAPWGIQNCVPSLNETAPFTDPCTSGTVNTFQRFSESYNSWVEPAMTADFADWFNRHADRAAVFAPGWDGTRSEQYPNGMFYVNSHSIGRDGETGLPDSTQAEYVLKDGPSESAKPLYLNWGCNGQNCAAFSGDITNPDFRADRIARIKASYEAGNYRGVWLDDVLMDMSTTDGVMAPPPNAWSGRTVAGWSPELGRYITRDDWRDAMATLAEELRLALPRPIEILHNAPWNAALWEGGIDNPDVQRQIRTATYINREGSFNDPGLKGGNAEWSVDALRAWVHGVHKLGAAMVFDGFDSSPAGKEYDIANYLAVSTGNDAVGLMNQAPTNWSPAYDYDLGKAKTLRPYRWNGLIRRDFTYGIVLVHDPADGDPNPGTISQTLPTPMRNAAGTLVSGVALPAGRGAVLRYSQSAKRTDVLAIGDAASQTSTTIMRHTRRGLAGPEAPAAQVPTAAPINRAGDINMDLLDEVVTVTPASPAGSAAASVRLIYARPVGASTLPILTRSILLGNATYGTFVTDMTGDKRADLATWNSTSVTVASSLVTSATVATWPIPADMHGDKANQLADMNNDKKADLVAWNTNGTVRVALSTGTGFAAPTTWLNSPGFVGSQGNLAGDLTGDGRGDLIAIDSGVVRIAPGTTTPGVSAPMDSTTDLGAEPGDFLGHSFAIRDMDGNSAPDLVFIGSNGIRYSSSWGDYLSAPERLILPMTHLGTKATLFGEFDHS